jgi:hypothetical protein
MRMIATASLLLGVLATASWIAPAAGQDKNEAKPQPLKGRLTVGKDTTYVTGPLDKDGHVDYVTALHERLSKGVTPENNANVLLWRAFGPHPEGAKMPARFFRLLGIQQPPERGPYFSDLFQYVKENTQIDVDKAAEALSNQLEQAGRRPWKEKDYPLLADWLKANEQPLIVVAEAARRPQYYSPLVPAGKDEDSAGLLGALLPAVQKCRGLAGALSARAMLRAGRGDPDGAWQDLLTCHRLGRLVARGGTLIEYLVGVAIDQITSNSDMGFLAGTKPDAKRAERYLRDLQNLPPFPAAADKVDVTERFVFLEQVSLLNRRGNHFLAGVIDPKDEGGGQRVERKLGAIDWDPALRRANQWYDRLVAALREKEYGVRQKKLDQIEAELKTLKEKLVDSGAVARLLDEKQAGPVVGQAVGDVLVTLLIPAVRKVAMASDRIRQVQANNTLAFALEWYQREHGRYPKTLDVLTPRYLKSVPGDLFSGKALIYRPSDEGYLLYSVGANGKDEGGRGYEDDPPGDDLSVRMALPKLRQP